MRKEKMLQEGKTEQIESAVPKGEDARKEGIVETRLYSGLVGEVVDSGDYCKSLDANGLCGYEYTIQKALQNDWIREHEKGLAEYLDTGSLKDKVISMYPTVEVWDYRLWGVLEVKSRGELTGEETARIKGEWRGQMMDGWGEGFVQDAIDCGEGCNLYVDFGPASWRGVFTEQELKGVCQEREGPKLERMDGIS